jgi:hypothetical protein
MAEAFNYICDTNTVRIVLLRYQVRNTCSVLYLLAVRLPSWRRHTGPAILARAGRTRDEACNRKTDVVLSS